MLCGAVRTKDRCSPDSGPCTFRAGHGGKHSWDRRAPRRPPRRALIEAAQEWTREHGKPPGYVDWQNGRGPAHVGTVVREFGSWSAFLKEAGVALVCGNPLCTRPRRAAFEMCYRCRRFKQLYGRDWTPMGLQEAQRRARAKEKVLQQMRDWYEEHGEPPTSRGWATAGPGKTTSVHVRGLFGSWNAAIELAGLQPRPQGRPKKRAS